MPSTQQDCEVQCPQGAEGEGGQEAVPEVLNSLSHLLLQCFVLYYRNVV